MQGMREGRVQLDDGVYEIWQPVSQVRDHLEYLVRALEHGQDALIAEQCELWSDVVERSARVLDKLHGDLQGTNYGKKLRPGREHIKRFSVDDATQRELKILAAKGSQLRSRSSADSPDIAQRFRTSLPNVSADIALGPDDPCEPRCYLDTLQSCQRDLFLDTSFIPHKCAFLRLPLAPGAISTGIGQALTSNEIFRAELMRARIGQWPGDLELSHLQMFVDDVGAFIRSSRCPRSSHSTGNCCTIDEEIGHEEDVSSGAEKDLAKENSTMCLSLVLCGLDPFRVSDEFPMSRKSYVSVVQAFKLPHDFLSFWKSKSAMVSTTHAPCHSHFLIRSPETNERSWVLALSWNRRRRRACGLMFGCDDVELGELLCHLDQFKDSPAHPLLLPMILCELVTLTHFNAARLSVSQLHKMRFQTHIKVVGEYWQHMKVCPSESQIKEYSGDLNMIISKLAVNELAIRANLANIAAILEAADSCDRIVAEEVLEVPADWEATRSTLHQRLQKAQVEHQALLHEISCGQKIAAGQLQIIFNLIAQRDAQENIRQAAASTEIARIAREDGFAMRTIAVMTIAFLPATAVSSLFSMGMFDWQAGADEPVVTRRF